MQLITVVLRAGDRYCLLGRLGETVRCGPRFCPVAAWPDVCDYVAKFYNPTRADASETIGT